MPADFIKSSARRVQSLSRLRPTLGMVLGSGFQEAVGQMAVDVRVPCAALRGWPPPTVPGHAGELVVGLLSRTPVLVLSGRLHYYEGHSMAAVTSGIRLMAALGIGSLLLTNAAGALNPRFRPGDLMMITDHLNFMGANPLRGTLSRGLERFVDLSEAYDAGLRARLQQAARTAGVKLRQGIYLAVSGPTYETPAEVRAFRMLGADAVGMSTVPEVIAARQLGLRVAALSCLTNLAAGVSRAPLSHEEVLETGQRVAPQAAALLAQFARLHED